MCTTRPDTFIHYAWKTPTCSSYICWGIPRPIPWLGTVKPAVINVGKQALYDMFTESLLGILHGIFTKSPLGILYGMFTKSPPGIKTNTWLPSYFSFFLNSWCRRLGKEVTQPSILTSTVPTIWLEIPQFASHPSPSFLCKKSGCRNC